MLFNNILASLGLLALSGLASAQDVAVSSATVEKITGFVATYGTTIGSTCGCGVLKLTYGAKKVLYPGSAAYTAEATHYWDLRSSQSPKCVFIPGSPLEVAAGVIALNLCKSQFAIRSGGHMPIPGAANTDGGVLLVTNSLNSLKIGADGKSVEVGAANDWYAVNKFLEPSGRIAVGGRLKTIGVSGLTIGGGISYFTAKYGFAMDNVISYEVVLASGLVVTASATARADLFWALKGGGSNFGIVTKFVLATYDVPAISTQIQIFLEPSVPGFITAVANLAKYQDQVDTGAGGVFTIGYTPSNGQVQAQFLGVQAGNVKGPEVFANFTAVPSIVNIQNVTTLAAWSATLDTPYQANRYQYGMHALQADEASLQNMWTAFKASAVAVAGIEGFSCNLVFQPIPKSATTVAKTNGVGNTWDVDNTKPYIYWLITSSWVNAADDAAVTGWATAIREKLHATNLANGVGEDLIYMNDAADDQKPFASFPKENLERLKTIRSKYDPTLVWKKLVTGGYKLD